MQSKLSKFRTGIILPLFFLFVLNSCEKDDNDITILTKEQKWATEVLTAMKDIYLWNDVLPAKLDVTKYNTAGDALEYLMGIKINSETGEAIDHYSFLDKIGALSGEITQGTASGDYGFMVTPAYNASNQVSFYVTYVYKNSPAGVGGVTRGDEVVSINGSDLVHPEVSSDGYLVSSSLGYINMVNALFNSQTVSIGFKKTNGTTFTAAMNVGSYSINSVLYNTIFEVGTKKAGYVVFNQFLGESSQTELTNVINNFEANNVKDVIIDLRYNGGGSVETCEKLCGMLAPATANGKVMYSYKMNAYLTKAFASEKVSLSVNFAKSNTFQPTTIYFIVGGGTASASELLINNLRPYFANNLFLIGRTTYGKPCGFWATPIGYTEKQTTTKEGYDLYAVSFESVNANNEGGYFAGMTPGTAKYPGVMANDSFWLPWGDRNDASLAQALNHIATKSFIASSAPSRIKAVQTTPVTAIDRGFKGMIDFRKHLK